MHTKNELFSLFALLDIQLHLVEDVADSGAAVELAGRDVGRSAVQSVAEYRAETRQSLQRKKQTFLHKSFSHKIKKKREDKKKREGRKKQREGRKEERTEAARSKTQEEARRSKKHSSGRTCRSIAAMAELPLRSPP